MHKQGKIIQFCSIKSLFSSFFIIFLEKKIQPIIKKHTFAVITTYRSVLFFRF